MGVEGVALATVIAQAVSAVLVLITLLRTDSCVKLIPKDLKMDFAVFKKIFNIGIPAALQMAVTGFANVFTQSYINFFGPDVMSGWTAYAKIDQLLFLPMQSIALASTTFVGQNLGINKVERARKGVNSALWIAVLSTVTMMIPLLIFAPQFVAFFNSKPEVVDYGANFLYWITPFYVLCCYNQIISGALRGAGDTKAPMLIMLSGFVVFRQVYLYIMANFICNEVIPIGMSYPAGWLLCTVLSLLYYNKVDLGKKRLVED
jgi:putative MATE family efflux protein